jgi:hypothetical protein
MSEERFNRELRAEMDELHAELLDLIEALAARQRLRLGQANADELEIRRTPDRKTRREVLDWLDNRPPFQRLMS